MKKLFAMVMTLALIFNVIATPVAVSETRADAVLKQLRDMAGITESTETATVVQNPLEFASGYVRVTGMTKIYDEPDEGEQIGQFTAGGVAWATVTDKVNEDGVAWLKIVFDTMAAAEEDEDFFTAYVLRDRVTILDEDAVYDIRFEYQKTACKVQRESPASGKGRLHGDRSRCCRKRFRSSAC